MLRFSTWKVAVILGICVLGAVLSLPNLFPRDEMERLPSWLPHQQINLGLDLQGGSHLLLEVDLHAVTEDGSTAWSTRSAPFCGRHGSAIGTWACTATP